MGDGMAVSTGQARERAGRDGIAAAFALLAVLLFAAAALDFRPAYAQLLLDHAVLKLIAGALALGVAVRLSRRLPPLSKPHDGVSGKPRRYWWAYVSVGALLIFAVAEVNIRLLNIPFLLRMQSRLQYALLTFGVILVGWGFSGAHWPISFSIRRKIDWSLVLPLSAILALALVLRLWDQGVSQRYLLDELHFSDAILLIEKYPTLSLFRPISDESPFTWLYPYWQSWAVALLGHNFVGFRFASAIIGTLTVLATYGLARELFDRRTALLAALLLATFPPHVHFSRTAIIQIVDPFFGTLVFMFLVRALGRNQRADWTLAGIALGMTQYFYEGARLLFPPLTVAFVMLLALRGGMRGKWRGFAILLATAFIVGAPIYYILLGSNHSLAGRMDDSGLGTSFWRDLAADGLSGDDLLQIGQHLLQPFQLFVTHPDTAVYYGGDQALILEYLVPIFLFGCFYLVWRYPAPAFLIPLWIVATALGNGLLRDTLVSSRYEEVLPALALALAAGVRYGLVFFWPEAAREARLRRAIPVLAVAVIAVAQVGYYFGPHLALLKFQVRDEKSYRDGIDAVLRAADLPGNTQIILVSKPENDPSVTRNWLSFLSRDGDPSRYFPLQAVTPDTISPKYLLDLPGGVNYAFFVAPTDRYAIAHIYRYFPNVEPPRYSPWDIPADKEYLLFYAPFVPRPASP